MKPTRVEIHVDRLVLEGVPPEQRRGVLDALEAELGRLIAEGGLPPGALSQPQRPSLPTQELVDVSSPKRTGEELARALYRGMGG